MKTSPKELSPLDKQQRQVLKEFVSEKLSNWRDLYKYSGINEVVGYREQDNTPFTAYYIKELFKQLKQNETFTLKIATPTTSTAASKPKQPLPSAEPVFDTPDKDIQDEYTSIPSLANNPTIKHVPYQERATSALLRGYLKYNYYGQALNSRTQSGKTYIIGALVKELYERGWPPLRDSISLYPVIYLTRASVVEQTERRMKKHFGLNPGKHPSIDVTNIDQMRCKFGEHFIKEVIRVVDGEEIFYYEWNEHTSPALLIIDEAQSVKNIDSTQSKIMQSFNELDGERHRVLFSSATLFTRVIESKCFAVSTRLQF